MSYKDFLNKEHNKALLRVIIETVILYILLIFVFNVVFPLLGIKWPENEISSAKDWSYPRAPLYFAGFIFPLVCIYVIMIVKDILKIRYIRTIIYSICFFTVVMLLALSAVPIFPFAIWFVLLPLAFLSPIISILSLFILYLDIKDFLGEENLENNNFINKFVCVVQKILNIFGYIIVPLFLIWAFMWTYEFSNSLYK